MYSGDCVKGVMVFHILLTGWKCKHDDMKYIRWKNANIEGRLYLLKVYHMHTPHTCTQARNNCFLLLLSL